MPRTPDYDLVREFIGLEQYVPVDAIRKDNDGRALTLIVRPKNTSRVLRLLVRVTEVVEL